MAKAAPFLITLAVLLVLSLAVTTFLKGTDVYEYAPYINAGLALVIVLAMYPKLKKVMDRYERAAKKSVR
ncbi:MAG TPA: hypothetical protein VFV52_06665 [Bacilli bacterium]|nr:hypothetical protein [Bacilli bacterium]